MANPSLQPTLAGCAVRSAELQRWAAHMRSTTSLAVLVTLSLLVETAIAGGWKTDPKSSVESNKLPPPGTILSEHSKKMAFGYLAVSREVVNGKGHWEGIGHFGFVYHKDRELCQCEEHEVLISPDGLFAIFVNTKTGKLSLYRAATGVRTELSRKYIGHPTGATWNDREVAVTVELERGTKVTTQRIKVAL